MAGKIPRQLVKNILGKRKNLMEQMTKVLANRKKQERMPRGMRSPKTVLQGLLKHYCYNETINSYN